MTTQHTDSVEAFARQLHTWYLEAIKQDGAKYNQEAATTYDMLPEGSKILDRYIASKILATQSQQVEEAVRNRNGVIREYKDKGLMFVLKVEDGKTYETSMPIPKWTEVGSLSFRITNHQD